MFKKIVFYLCLLVFSLQNVWAVTDVDSADQRPNPVPELSYSMNEQHHATLEPCDHLNEPVDYHVEQSNSLEHHQSCSGQVSPYALVHTFPLTIDYFSSEAKFKTDEHFKSLSVLPDLRPPIFS